MVVKFSLPKLIVPDESVIDPSPRSRLPNCEPEPAVSVPEVVKFSLPKAIAPDESVIDPLASVRSPNVIGEVKVCAPLKVNPDDVV